jgi:tetratricopeptide (TPR) repeat protein
LKFWLLAFSLALSAPAWANGPDAARIPVIPPPPPAVYVTAALLALLPALGFGLFLFVQFFNSATRGERANRRLVQACVVAVGLTIIIVAGEAAYFSQHKPAIVTADGTTAGKAGETGAGGTSDVGVNSANSESLVEDNSPDTDGSKCQREYTAAQKALSQQDFESAITHINRALHYNDKRADLHIFRAMINLDYGRTLRALDDLNAVLKADPHESEALLARCRTYFARQEYDLCLNDAHALLEQNKHNVDAQLIMGNVKMKQNDFSGALDDLDKAQKLDPGNLAVAEAMGDVYFAQKKYQEALHSYDNALREKTSNSQILFKRGRCLFELAKYQESFDDLSAAVHANPSIIEYRRNLALALYKLNKLPAALDELDQALHADPYDDETIKAAKMIAGKLAAESESEIARDKSDAKAHTALAYARYMTQDYPAALKAIDQAIKLAPTNARNYFLAGECAIEAKQNKQAVDFLTKAIELEPENINALFEIARAESAMENFQESIANYSKFLAKCPDRNKAAGFIARGICYINLRDFKNTIADFSESLKYSPNNAEVYALRGDAYGCLEDRSHALDDLKLAMALDPKRPLCRRNYCDELLREGKIREAREAAKQALEIKPKDPSLHALMSQICWLSADYHEALDEANIAVALDPNTAKLRSQQAAVFWILDRNADLKKSCDFLKTGAEGKDKGQAYSDVYFSGFWPYIFYSSLDDKNNARSVLDAAAARMDGNVWPHPIFEFMRRKIGANDLLSQRKDLWSLTEVHCYMGFSQYYNGEKEEAKQNLKWVVDNGRKDFLEYMLAEGLVRKNKW